MNPCKKNLVFICLLLLLIAPLGLYFYKFKSSSLSTDTEVWGQFGDFLNGTFMPLIALIGVIVTYMLGVFSEERTTANIKLDQQKQRPLLHVGFFDSELQVRIFMVNKGNGPLIITNYRLINLEGEIEFLSIYELLPEIEGIYSNYSGNLNNIVLSPSEEFELLNYETPYTEGLGYPENDRDIIRETLSNYKIVIDFCDVYNNKMPQYQRSLSWFGR